MLSPFWICFSGPLNAADYMIRKTTFSRHFLDNYFGYYVSSDFLERKKMLLVPFK